MNDCNPSITPAPAVSNTPVPSAATAPVGPPTALTTPPDTALQIAQMLAAGTIDTTQAGKLSKAGNISTLQVAQALSALRADAEPQEPDLRSPEVKQLDAAFPKAKESDYTIRYGRPGEDVKETPELKAFDANARGWLAGAGFPRDLGNTLVTTIEKVSQTTKSFSAEQLDDYGAREFVKLERAYGPALEEKLNAAGQMVHELEQRRPGLKRLLKSKGIGDNALIASMLIGHAAIYHARKGRS